MQESVEDIEPLITVERLTDFHGSDLSDLCDCMEKTIDDGLGFSIGFNWLKAPSRERVEQYWEGLLLVPQREIYVGRVDGTIAGSIQLLKPSPSNQSQSFAAQGREHFVAPWARGHGLAKFLLKAIEDRCAEENYKILKLDVRATQEAATHLYEDRDYKKWGELDKYEMVEGEFVKGYFYYKDIK